MSRLKFRRKEKKYTEVYNTIIFKNKNVELTGLYTTIQACIDLEINTKGTDKEFVVSKKTLQSFTGYKDDKFKRIWNELKQAGYLKQYKIKSESGKFEYEYELLDEPDLTTHHSLIVKDDGLIVPNIPKSKIDKLINENNPGVENPPVVPEGGNPHSGEKGDYYNTSLNKVCIYVCKANENFSLTNKNKEYIKSIKDKIEFDLFDEIVSDAFNKNKTFRYATSTINKLIEKNITTLDAFLEDKKNYKPKRKSKDKGSSKSSAPQVKTRFHNINQTFKKYEENELVEVIERSQSDKFDKDTNDNDNEIEELRNKVIEELENEYPMIFDETDSYWIDKIEERLNELKG